MSNVPLRVNTSELRPEVRPDAAYSRSPRDNNDAKPTISDGLSLVASKDKSIYTRAHRGQQFPANRIFFKTLSFLIFDTQSHLTHLPPPAEIHVLFFTLTWKKVRSNSNYLPINLIRRIPIRRLIS
ncbi:hypothetical protein Ddye_000112 [Dipteronia dyeriana]|uniref:Uncharacterized protein n=1 Tax=Dipteronia dyeriana TaxID=168575 RepID=A0AAD9XMB2_9ROSI|nr:hypothetical protein Ddye_000112 [Dipteronia dyeriana]